MRNLTDFGAFVELEPGVDGLLHISDMSWTRNVGHPSEILKKGQAIETQILNVDRENKRISLGLKQIQPDPWDACPAVSRWAPASRARWSASPTSAPSWSWSRASTGCCTSRRCPTGPSPPPEDVVNVGDELTLHGDPGRSQRAADRALASRSSRDAIDAAAGDGQAERRARAGAKRGKRGKSREYDYDDEE